MFKDKKIMIFDLDGTLIDTLGMWNEVDREVIKEAGGLLNIDVQEEREKIFAKHMSGNIYVKYEESLLEKCHIPMSLQDFHDLRWEISQRYLATVVDFKPDAIEFLNLLKENNYTLVLATSSTRETLKIYMQRNEKIYNNLRFDDTFDLILTRDEVELKKPHPEIYLKVLELLKATADDCLVFEDSLIGIQSAQAAGIDVVNVYDEHSQKDQERINGIVKYPAMDYKTLIKLFNGD